MGGRSETASLNCVEPGEELLLRRPLNEMELSVPCRKSGTMGRKKTGRSPPNAFCYVARCRGLEQEVLRLGLKALEESVFGPCTLRRTWGTRP